MLKLPRKLITEHLSNLQVTLLTCPLKDTRTNGHTDHGSLLGTSDSFYNFLVTLQQEGGEGGLLLDIPQPLLLALSCTLGGCD